MNDPTRDVNELVTKDRDYNNVVGMQKRAQALPKSKRDESRCVSAGADAIVVPATFLKLEETRRKLAEEDGGELPIPNIPLAFWEMRPLFGQIRDFAHSHGASADSMLGYLLAATSAFMPHGWRIDSGTDEPTPPNLFVNLIGPSGAGKSRTQRAGTLAINTEHLVNPQTNGLIGSGEGVAEAFMGTKKVDDPENIGKKIAQRMQVRHNVLIKIDEGELLKKLASREGASIMAVLRTAFMGSPIGQNNAKEETTRKAENYNLGVITNFTPDDAVAVLDGLSSGTPQRQTWFSACDPSRPKSRPSRKRAPAINILPGNSKSGLITFEPRIADAIWDNDVEVGRGEVTPEELDKHKPLIMVRIAAIFCVWDGRCVVDSNDWDFAGVIWDSSCAVREWVINRRNATLAKAEEEKARQRATTAVIVTQAVKGADNQVARVAASIAGKVNENNGMTTGAIRKALASRDRPLLDTALQRAEGAGWIVQNGDNFWLSGGKIA